METRYSVWLNANLIVQTSDLEEAIREWDAASSMSVGTRVGGIAVLVVQDGVIVRDGWILHLLSNGHVYLNPGVAA